jgi:dihydrolipoamide dehydrogenase
MSNGNKESYDVTIIGGGAGGYMAALEAAGRQLKVALIEKERVGGTCLNRGCVPTQCLLHDMNAFSSFMKFDFTEKERESIKLNLKNLMERKNRVVDLLVDGTEKTLLSHGVSIFRGRGTFLDPQKIIVHPSETIIKSRYFIIATGVLLRPEIPFEIDHRKIWDSTDAIQMGSVPESIAILGNGKRSMTFADIFHFLGSRVSVITTEGQILSDQDDEISNRYRKVLRNKNIKLLTHSRVTSVEPEKFPDATELIIETQKGIQSLRVSKVLILGERQANVDELDLNRLGLFLKERFVPVGQDMKTNLPGIYAVGDVIGGKFAAHKAMLEGVGAVKELSGEKNNINYDLLPTCLYTNPEVASIGLTQKEAERRGENIELGYFPIAAGARPAIFGEQEGIIKVIVGKKYKEILGVHIIGSQATELISLASVFMKNELTVYEIKEMIYPHPSFAENFGEAIKDVMNMMGKS